MGVSREGTIRIEEQGSFFTGGKVIRWEGIYNPQNFVSDGVGQTHHGDQAYDFWQRPENCRPLPILFLHGHNQSSKTWETTPDGRSGFEVHLIDQPRRGKAGKASISGEIRVVPDDQRNFNAFRLGVWPDFYETCAFPRSADALDQLYKQGTPNTAAYDPDIAAEGVAAIADRVGDCILISHSQGCDVAWKAVMRSRHIRAVVALERGCQIMWFHQKSFKSSAGFLSACFTEILFRMNRQKTRDRTGGMSTGVQENSCGMP